MDIENEQAEKIVKCVKFFMSLMRLSKKQTLEDINNHTNVEDAPTKYDIVIQLVKDLIYGDLSPETFTTRLIQTIKSQAQSNLLPFLLSTLPGLKLAFMSGEQMIEEIGTFEDYKAAKAALLNNSTQNVQMSNSGFQHVSNSSFEHNHAPFDSLAALDASIDGVIHSAAASVSSQPPPHSNNSAPVSAIPLSSQENLPTSIPNKNIMTGPTSPFTSSSSLPVNSTIVNRHDIHIEDHLNYNCLLNFKALAKLIHDAMPDSDFVDYNVLVMISNAVEARLRLVVRNLAVAAEHRLEPLRTNINYKLIDDPRRQIRFMENIERHAFERHENLEREAILKFSKSKGKDKDAMERAKQMQKADKEAAINRDANAAAIAALGTSKNLKRSAPGQSISGGLNPVGSSAQPFRSRVKRVTMQDLKFVMSQDPLLSKSDLFYKITLSNVD